MKKDKNIRKILYLMLVVVMTVTSIIFVAGMGYLNYKTSVFKLYDTIIFRLEDQVVFDIEKALDFGKDYNSFYGMDKYISDFDEMSKGAEVVCVDLYGKPLYTSIEDNVNWKNEVSELLEKAGFPDLKSAIDQKGSAKTAYGSKRILGTTIHAGKEPVGYFLAIYDRGVYSKTFSDALQSTIIQVLIIIGIQLFLVAFVMMVLAEYLQKNENEERRVILSRALPLIFISGGIVFLSLSTIYTYQKDFNTRIRHAAELVLEDMKSSISEVEQSGVDLKRISDLDDYVISNMSEMAMIRSVRISGRILEVTDNEEESDIITFKLGEDLYLEAEISDSQIEKEMRVLRLVLLSSLIILMIYVFETFNIVELASNRIANAVGDFEPDISRQVALGLRITGFLCSTGEYMCVPYAAMMIRENGSSLFGLTVGLTAALPLTMEGVAQIVGMLAWPNYVKKINIKRVLVISTFIMMACNAAAFYTGGKHPGSIIICRTVAGFAYAGFKQISNYLITRSYEISVGAGESKAVSQEVIEEAGNLRSENFSQDNAGLLAGATCGAGLGAILSANLGYESTFIISLIVFLLYLVITWFMLPWKQLAGDIQEEQEQISFNSIVEILKAPSVWKYILIFAIPLNVGAMLCVTLIPAICQDNDISSVILSFVYIANGLAGIYVGPMLVSRAKKFFGTNRCVAFAFLITGVSIFILKLPMVIVMIIISGMILGFLDGFATPLVTDYFMEIDEVKKSVDESTALIFSVELSYVLLTFAPLIAELLLIPGKGIIQPLYIGAGLYACAAVFVRFSKGKRA